MNAIDRRRKPRATETWIPEDVIVTMYRQSLHKRTQIDILAQLNDVPKPVIEEILQRYGCKVGATRRLVRTAAEKHLWTSEEDEFIRNGYNAGMDQKSMADELGRTIFAVKARLHTLEINKGRGKGRNARKNKACESAAGEEE